MEWSNLNPNVISVIGVFAVPVTAIIAHFWHAGIKVKADSELKRTMVEQGRSADEIERVLGMKSGKGAKKTTAG